MKRNLTKWVISILVTLVTILICFGIGLISSFNSFVFSWTLNLSLMFWYLVLVSQINPKLDSSYFNQKPFEKNGGIYKYFGVQIYRKLLVWVGWEKVIKKANPIKNSLIKLKICEHNTRVSELGHIIIAIIVFITGIFLSNSLVQAKWFIITNLLLNIYPVLVQRFNRPRYSRLIDRKNFEKNLSYDPQSL